MSKIKFQGNAITTIGVLPKVGSTLPQFTLTDSNLNDLTNRDFIGRKKIICIVPSIDTAVCATEARKFNAEMSDKNIIILMVSADLPFAHGRFCAAEGIKNVKMLSTFRSNFAKEFGVMISDSVLTGLCSRAVIVTDENDKIIYSKLI
ncbi:MAG: thiol peroxidase, partial [Lentisphaeria bacterium]